MKDDNKDDDDHDHEEAEDSKIEGDGMNVQVLDFTPVTYYPHENYWPNSTTRFSGYSVCLLRGEFRDLGASAVPACCIRRNPGLRGDFSGGVSRPRHFAIYYALDRIGFGGLSPVGQAERGIEAIVIDSVPHGATNCPGPMTKNIATTVVLPPCSWRAKPDLPKIQYSSVPYL